MTTTRSHRVLTHLRRGPARLFRVALWMLLVATWGGVVHAGGPCRAGQPLAEALNALRDEGLGLSFSSILVRPSMVVEVVPRSPEPRRALEELLVPHGLTVREGQGGALLVIRATQPLGTPASLVTPPRSPAEPAPSFSAPPLAIDWRDGAPVTSLNDAIEVTSNRDRRPVRPISVAVKASDLQGRPTARDPWSLLRLAPGVTSERVNVGGSEAGNQMRFTGPGTTSHENNFTIDGVNATDMTAIGTSSTYYDFDQLEEVRIGTGGADVRTAVAGVSIELVTKRGVDVARGSARVLGVGGVGGSSTIGAATGGADGASGPQLQGNRVHGIDERGGELGGPLIAGKVWGWAAASVTRIDAQAVDGAADDTRLDHRALKLNFQWGNAISGVLSASHSNKRKPSRSAGPERGFEATWRQTGPTFIGKLEGTRQFGSNTLITGQLSWVDGGFRLSANGGEGPTGGEALLDADGVWKNGMISGPTDRASRRVQVDGSRFQPWRGLDHELRFGGSARRYTLVDSYVWPGARQAYNVACENFGTCGEFGTGDWVVFGRVGTPASDLDYQAAWLQDRIQTRRATFDLGLRFDRQLGANRTGSALANPVVPDFLPALTSQGGDGGFAWETVSPRLGVVIALGKGRTRLRSTLGRFVEQLSTSDVARLDPVEEAEATFYFDDLNGDNIWQSNEPTSWQSTIGVDGLNPNSGRSPNLTDPRLRPEVTDEWVVGLERSVGSNVVLALDLTMRRIDHIADERLLVADQTGQPRSASLLDYRLDRMLTIRRPDGVATTVPFFALNEGVTPTGGTLLTNGERERHYAGVTLRFQRRQAGRWSLRGHVNYGQADWRVPNSFRVNDDPTDVVGGGDNDGGLHAERIEGRDVAFLHSTWSGSVEAQLQIAPLRRWGFNVAANVFAREGFPLPYFVAFRSSADGLLREAQLTDAVDEFRTDAVVAVDLRLDKTIPLGKTLTARGLRATAAVDIFNLLDERPILRREVNLALARGNAIDATLAPRVIRFGVRLQWH